MDSAREEIDADMLSSSKLLKDYIWLIFSDFKHYSLKIILCEISDILADCLLPPRSALLKLLNDIPPL